MSASSPRGKPHATIRESSLCSPIARYAAPLHDGQARGTSCARRSLRIGTAHLTCTATQSRLMSFTFAFQFSETMAFTDFTDCFPKTKLPLDFGELSYREFQTKAHLLPDALMAEWIAPLEAELDEFTEILPVAKFSKKGYVALVYWKAGLLHNHYRLATFDKLGNPIENRVIAGSYIENDEVSTSAATITKDHIIYVVSGQEVLGERLGQAATTSAVRLGIDDGGIISVLTDPNDN